jgi:hypothetical protein
LRTLYEIEVEADGRLWHLRSILHGMADKVFKASGVAVPPSPGKPNAMPKLFCEGGISPFTWRFENSTVQDELKDRNPQT